MKNDLEHHDFKLLRDWIDKHNLYSEKEMEEFFKNNNTKASHKLINPVAKVKRAMKNNIYYKLPIGIRAHLYYWYRYYLQLGFLDGKEGKIFCFLQAYWYRFLVDAKIYERKLMEQRIIGA